MQETLSRKLRAIEPSLQAEANWVALISQLGFMSQYQTECTPGYYNGEGKAGNGEGFLEGQYPEGPVQFYKLLEDWRESGALEGIEGR